MTTQRIDFATLDDARTWYVNNGVSDWEWFDGFDEDEFVDYLFQHAQDDVDINYFIAEFLITRGENPRDYGIRPVPVCFLCGNYGLITEATDEVEVMESMQPICAQCREETWG